MAVEQLSIWDNAVLEQGYHSLSGLRFGEAAGQFREALKGATDRGALEKALSACEFWQSKVPAQSATRLDRDGLEPLVQDFIGYPFTGPLSGLRKALLLHIADAAGNAKEINLPMLETVFDLLLALPGLPAAMQLVRQAIGRYPEKKCLLYLLGQAQWLNGNKTEAKANYTRACLLYPDEEYGKRIEMEEVKIAVQQFGIAWAPVYGWIRGYLPLLPLREEIAPMNEDHRQAVTIYRLLALSEEAMKKNDLKTSIRCRKEIKAIKPDLFQAYFRLLQRRKGMLLLTGEPSSKR